MARGASLKLGQSRLTVNQYLTYRYNFADLPDNFNVTQKFDPKIVSDWHHDQYNHARVAYSSPTAESKPVAGVGGKGKSWKPNTCLRS